jgi:hypothetical protein
VCVHVHTRTHINTHVCMVKPACNRIKRDQRNPYHIHYTVTKLSTFSTFNLSFLLCICSHFSNTAVYKRAHHSMARNPFSQESKTCLFSYIFQEAYKTIKLTSF